MPRVCVSSWGGYREGAGRGIVKVVLRAGDSLYDREGVLWRVTLVEGTLIDYSIHFETGDQHIELSSTRRGDKA